MIRSFLAAALTLLTLFSFTAYAAGGIYFEYTPPSERGSIFYIDIYSDYELSAAVFELSFDSSAAEYRASKATNSTSSCRTKEEDGRVRIAFADTDSVKGDILSLSFKAASSGECRFVLKTEQAVDKNLDYLTGLKDYTFTVSFDKDGVSSDAGGISSKTRSSGKQSEKTGLSSENDETQEGVVKFFSDFGVDRGGTYFILGAAAVVLAGGLVLLGFIIGKRAKTKKKTVIPDGDEESADKAERDETDRV